MFALTTVLILFSLSYTLALFLVMRSLHLNNTLAAVVLPGSIAALNVLLMRNAFMALPSAVEELVCLLPVSVLVRSTRAPSMTATDVSLIVPCMAPRN